MPARIDKRANNTGQIPDTTTAHGKGDTVSGPEAAVMESISSREKRTFRHVEQPPGIESLADCRKRWNNLILNPRR